MKHRERVGHIPLWAAEPEKIIIIIIYGQHGKLKTAIIPATVSRFEKQDFVRNFHGDIC
jgi:hypothetical protein